MDSSRNVIDFAKKRESQVKFLRKPTKKMSMMKKSDKNHGVGNDLKKTDDSNKKVNKVFKKISLPEND